MWSRAKPESRCTPAQARQMDPEYGRQAGDEDGWDEALGYMDAGPEPCKP